MATINLGRVKPVFRGAYDASTSYVIDDIVTYQNETYIAITATTGNLPTVTANWTKLAAKGTDGTDVSTTLTTQGDLLFRDGSGLQRLAIGTAGQVLQVNSGATAPEYGTISSDFVKLNHTDSTSAVTNHTFQSIFDDTTYDGYKIMLHTEMPNNDYVLARWMSGSTELSGTYDYRKAGSADYRREDNSDNTASSSNDGDGRDHMDITNWNFSDATGTAFFNTIEINGALQDTSNNKQLFNRVFTRDNSGGASGDYFAQYVTGFMYLNYSQSVDGIKFYSANGGNFERFKCSIYGMKK